MKHPEIKSTILELRKEIPKKDQIIKTVIGFCNHHGGKIVIGVADNREIIGIPEEEAAAGIEFLSKAVYEDSTPPILPLIYIQRIDDKTLLVIEVAPGTHRPYYRKKEGLEKGTYIRFGTSTLRATPDIIEELKLRSHGKIYDMIPVHQAEEIDLKKDAIQMFIQEKKNRPRERLSKDLLLSYYLLQPEHRNAYPTVAGLLLFERQPQKFFPEAFIMCTHYKGDEGRDVIASLDCTGTLFEQFHSAFNFIIDRLSRSFSIDGVKRQEILEVPEEAVREALTNAIVHRNYNIISSIKIGIYNNRIELLNPGSFVAPINNRTTEIRRKLHSKRSYLQSISRCRLY